MNVAEARALIGKAFIAVEGRQRWMDLGCGTGTFTRALAELLPAGSTILAVDQDAAVLRSLPTAHRGIHITTQVSDVAHMAFPRMDGVLMANVLHFIADQRTMVFRLAEATTQVVLVEYDRSDPLPPWVPYPVPQSKAVRLFADAGFIAHEGLGTRASRYGPDPLYAMALHKQATVGTP